MILENNVMTREDLKSTSITKEEYLAHKIKVHYSTNDKRRKFLLANIEDFSNFMKMEEGKIFDYTTLDIIGFRLLANNGQDVNILRTIDDFGYFLNRKLEEYCIELALKGIE